MLIPLLDATAVNITHGINILLTSLICGSEAATPPPPFFFFLFFFDTDLLGLAEISKVNLENRKGR